MRKILEVFITGLIGLLMALAFFGMFWVSFFFDRLPV
jgi:hypothetical protein